MKSFYSIPEVGNHWFATYHTHHKEKLEMTKSIDDLYLLFKSEPLGIMGIQTNNTLILANNSFVSIEEKAIKSAKIMTKDREHFISAHPLKFNSA